MKNNQNRDKGLKKIIDKYKKAFHIPENIYYYSKEDYNRAERKFIKFAIHHGSFSILLNV